MYCPQTLRLWLSISFNGKNMNEIDFDCLDKFLTQIKKIQFMHNHIYIRLQMLHMVLPLKIANKM